MCEDIENGDMGKPPDQNIKFKSVKIDHECRKNRIYEYGVV